MKIFRVSSFIETIAKLIFLVLPTSGVCYYLILNANNYYSILQNDATQQSMYLFFGMVSSLVFYAFRFRFLSTFAILLITFYITYKGLDATAIGEFDSFFISIQFLIFSSLFSFGCLIGAAFARWRHAHYLVAASVLIISVIMIARQKFESFGQLFPFLFLAILFSFYIIFAAEQIYNFKEKTAKFWWFMTRRIALFLLFIGLTSLFVAKQMKSDFESAIEKASGNGKEGEQGMLKKDKKGNFDLKDYSQLRSNQGRSNDLLFAAHIDNFFPGTDIPNPLYLTAFYYTKFDTSTETFERDKQIPKNDLFEPNVAQIALYSSKTDSSVIKNGMGDKTRRVVELEVYSKKLSPETYLAPNIGFYVQPIAIEKDFRGAFQSAFRAKGYVSELNSAYFIYNAKDPQIKKFQEQRFALLRNVESYKNVDKQFMAYYTKMPTDKKFQQISDLAKNITKESKMPIDKVLALRDYFLSKDEEGKALFSYTDNPGVPDIPSASKLMYFLFDNHKGYCAYYAGATLFMLRSLGIPSRITVGFMTIDRSDKNKGWYWYYADQAHAWVQVYFPGYGWIDFDTTVGNDDAQESPKPDGTPPMQPPHAWFATEGKVIAIDTLKKSILMNIRQFVFHDKEFIESIDSIEMDVSVANIQRDSISISLNEIRVGDSATVVSYAETIKNMNDASSNEKGNSIINRMPKMIPIDDVYLKNKKEKLEVGKLPHTESMGANPWISYLKLLLFSLLSLIVVFFLVPTIVFYTLKLLVKSSEKPELKAYWQYMTIQFYLHLLGFFRGGLTPLQYVESVIDPFFKTKYKLFMIPYLKMKYSGIALSIQEVDILNAQYLETLKKIKSVVKSKARIVAFLRPLRALNFFTKGF